MVTGSRLTRFDLTGRVAIVTGGAGLLGLQHGLALLESGACVFLTDVRASAARAAVESWPDDLGKSRVHVLKMDVTDLTSITAALHEILRLEHRIDILINNAAVDPKATDKGSILETSRLENFSLEEWNQQIAVGLTGAFLCSQVFGHHMAVNGGGVVLNIASDLSVLAPDQRLYRREGLPDEEQPVKPVTYSVIKSGVVGLTRYLATYWAAQGVRVNALSPGGVYDNQPVDFVNRLVNRIPLARMAQPDEYRGAIQFLCSDAAKYMTGQNILIDGGRSVL